jgi:hypothetical protein
MQQCVYVNNTFSKVKAQYFLIKWLLACKEKVRNRICHSYFSKLYQTLDDMNYRLLTAGKFIANLYIKHYFNCSEMLIPRKVLIETKFHHAWIDNSLFLLNFLSDDWLGAVLIHYCVAPCSAGCDPFNHFEIRAKIYIAIQFSFRESIV